RRRATLAGVTSQPIIGKYGASDNVRSHWIRPPARRGFVLFLSLIQTSRVQEQRRVFNEELRVLVVRAVIGIGMDDQLRIRHVLLDDERVHRGYVHVVTAVHDEFWL